jgi:hypothetical protein
MTTFSWNEIAESIDLRHLCNIEKGQKVAIGKQDLAVIVIDC